MTAPLFDRYISHPGSTTEDEPTLLLGEGGRLDNGGHLRTVADRMLSTGIGGAFADGTPFDTVAEVVGLTHDFTKLTRWAQRHLRDQPFQQSDVYRYHAFSSCLVTLYCLECLDDVGEYAAEIGTLVVAGHHNVSAPPDPGAMAETHGRLTNQVRGRYERVTDQFDDIDTHAPSRANRIIEAATNGLGSWKKFLDWHHQRVNPLDGAHDHLLYFADLEDEREGDYYDDLVRLWTALKFGDQTAASGLSDEELTVVRPDRTRLEEHVTSLDPGEGTVRELNRLRDRARREATENVTSLLGSDAVGLITLPTGFGKTYAGLSAGLRAAEQRDSRLIYTLPYTSILDQIAAEIQAIFDVSPYSRAFSIHHHLSDTYTGLSDKHTDADIGRSAGALHAESWRSGLTLTTTVQLFESLAAPTARQATRIPALQDAVVVVDEPQTIPDAWWKIVPRLVELLVEQYDATVILMTATQPGLVKHASSPLATRELTEDASTYTDFLRCHPRVTYRLDKTVRGNLDEANTIGYAEAGERICEVTADGTDSLAVCNTRASAQELYQSVITVTSETQSRPVELGRLLHNYVDRTGELPSGGELRQAALAAKAERGTNRIHAYLSGDVRPNDRARLIAALYDDDIGGSDVPAPLLEQEGAVVLIATSIVEAGVDISFDRVFRDYAPIPNLVQSGGRCNRSFGGTTGEVLVWRLATPASGGRIPCLAIHGGDGGDALPLLRETGRVLDQYATEGVIEEGTMVSEVVGEFYEALFTGRLDPGDETLVTAVDEAAMADLADERMIQDIDAYEDVLAPLTDQEQEEALQSGVDMTVISRYPGAQVNTDPRDWAEEVLLGSARYLILDARGDGYHPVFGVQ